MFQPQFIDNSVMRGHVHAIRTLKGLVADLRFNRDAFRHCLRLVLEIESLQIFAAVHKSMFKFWQQSYNFQNSALI